MTDNKNSEYADHTLLIYFYSAPVTVVITTAMCAVNIFG